MSATPPGDRVDLEPGASAGATRSYPDWLLDAIRAETLDVYRASPVRLREDASQEAEIAHDYQGRLVYELLQNADDAMADTGNGRILFRVTDTDLWVANSGRSLTEDDVRGLCGIGASLKSEVGGPRRASIGHKGMGFKSVFEITSTPEVYSSTHSLRMDAGRALVPVADLMASLGQSAPKRCPIMRFPWPTEESPSEWRGAAEQGHNVLFRFPFDQRVTFESRVHLADKLLELPATSILFLKHLVELEIQVEMRGREEHLSWTLERQRRIDDRWDATSGLAEAGLYRVWVASNRGETWCFLIACAL
jgi:hypothetical protein